ncbi:hypothetical protein EX895_001074 [Sporisorium graminicola]|uniref:Uncharacterized protein n=1 Tax=Sporisorium graminicola TaxID=280036 RepID=A0A4U7KZK3_9BASI|nr:hypothetical protein EX895_001074 [Sporisorium graminicola]TKY89777.1 hypothetical protein EX895_001074 [Sporisorium graminicola]
MSDHQASTILSTSNKMSTTGSTSQRAGFGSSFARRPAAHNTGRNVTAVSLSACDTRQDRPSSFAKQFDEHSGLLETALDSAFNTPSNASSLSSSLPVSVDNSPSATSPAPGPANEHRLLSRQIMQLSGSMAACVHQNELVISLLERLVALSEGVASRHLPTGDGRVIYTAPSAPLRERLASIGAGSTSSTNSSSSSASSGRDSRSSTAVTASSAKPTHSYVLHHMVDEVMTVQQNAPNMTDPNTGLNALYSAPVHNAPVNFGTVPGAAIVMHHASRSYDYQETAPMATTNSSVHALATMDDPASCASAGFSSLSAAMTANAQTNMAPLMCYTSMSSTPTSLFMSGSSNQGHMARRSSVIFSTTTQRDGSDFPYVASVASIQPLSEDGQQQKKRKRVESEDEADSDGASQPAAAEANAGSKDDAGAWQDWQLPRQHPLSVLEALPKAKHRVLREVRAEIKASSSRPSGAVGRIPLKQYLEVSGPEECRAVRRLGRKLYTAWLEPNTRFGKQDSTRLSACVNRIEYTFPVLADCEEHWKARQVMLQIIDNAIDEHKSSERRNTSLANAGVSDTPSRRRGRPKGTTAAAMAQRRHQQTLTHPSSQDTESQDTDADGSDLSDSETES